MTTTAASQPFLQAYSASFRLHTHLLLALGHERAKPQLNTDDEEEITDVLYQNIHRLLLEEPDRWMANYAVKNEDPISGGKYRGKARREIDLVIELSGRGRPQYIFEAKPLNWSKKHQRTRNYVHGTSGMGRFMAGEYATYTARFPEVGMIGYVLSDSIEEWCKRLKTEIDKEKIVLQLCGPQEDVSICDAFLHEWKSEHTRDSSEYPIMIHHILLDCQ